MPKLPHISGLAIVKALERLGFEKLRQSGSHVICSLSADSRAERVTVRGSKFEVFGTSNRELRTMLFSPSPSPKKAIDRLLLDRYKGAEYKGSY
jgi:predicted RNA binding protein YcfA (HicA-like mRNA interferase family)